MTVSIYDHNSGCGQWNLLAFIVGMFFLTEILSDLHWQKNPTHYKSQKERDTSNNIRVLVHLLNNMFSSKIDFNF